MLAGKFFIILQQLFGPVFNHFEFVVIVFFAIVICETNQSIIIIISDVDFAVL